MCSSDIVLLQQALLPDLSALVAEFAVGWVQAEEVRKADNGWRRQPEDNATYRVDNKEKPCMSRKTVILTKTCLFQR